MEIKVLSFFFRSSTVRTHWSLYLNSHVIELLFYISVLCCLLNLAQTYVKDASDNYRYSDLFISSYRLNIKE